LADRLSHAAPDGEHNDTINEPGQMVSLERWERFFKGLR
jgi:hypothetical protein